MYHFFIQIPSVEQLNKESEEVFVILQKLMETISTKEVEINDVEQMCDEIQEIENPSTLNANLSNLRSKWQQVINK